MRPPKCRFCGSKNLTDSLHSPRFSRIDLQIVQCNSCLLIQGICDEDAYSKENDVYKDPSLVLSEISCDSQYSSIRVGKQQMAEKFAHIMNELPLNAEGVGSVIDVRSARGSFITRAPNLFPSAHTFVGLEQDLYLHPATDSYDRNLIRICDHSVYSFPKPAIPFDFAYSCHTLEHYRDPNRYLQSVKSLLSQEGYLFIDVPSVSDFVDEDILDDFFYDKHLIYFTKQTLSNLLISNGFNIIWERESGNGCIEMLVQADENSNGVNDVYIHPNHVKATQISEYSQRLSKNRAALPKISRNMMDHIRSSRGEAVAFGAGRILDAFRVYGRLNVEVFDYFIDNYLSEATETVNGLPIQRLSALDQLSGLIFVLFTRNKSVTLEEMISACYPSCVVLHWTDFKDAHNPTPSKLGNARF